MLEIGHAELVEFTRFIRLNFGINLEAKHKLVEGRLGNYILEAGLQAFPSPWNTHTTTPRARNGHA